MQSSNIQKIFSNMKNITQNIQNGSFHIKKGFENTENYKRSQARQYSLHFILQEGGHMGACSTPPSYGSALTCMLKMLLMYFKFVNLILVFWHSISWKNLNCNFWTKKAWFPARYVTISVKVKHFWIDEIKFLNFKKSIIIYKSFLSQNIFLCSNWEFYSEKLLFFLTSNFYLYAW